MIWITHSAPSAGNTKQFYCCVFFFLRVCVCACAWRGGVVLLYHAPLSNLSALLLGLWKHPVTFDLLDNSSQDVSQCAVTKPTTGTLGVLLGNKLFIVWQDGPPDPPPPSHSAFTHTHTLTQPHTSAPCEQVSTSVPVDHKTRLKRSGDCPPVCLSANLNLKAIKNINKTNQVDKRHIN